MLAHELVHIKRHDTVLAGVAVLVAAPGRSCGAPRRVRRPCTGLIGPGREFSADQRAAVVVRYPPGIRSALQTMLGSPAPARAVAAVGRAGRRAHPLALGRPDGRASGRSPPDGNLDDTRVRAAALSLD